MRKAVDELLKKAWVHDVGETAAMAGVGSLIHAANGMEAEDIAQNAAFSAATGLASRPAFRIGGRAIGKALDNRFPDAQMPNAYNYGMATMVPGSRQSVQLNEAILNDPNTNKAVKTLLGATTPALKARRDAFMNIDGQELGRFEGDISLLGRMFGDNLAQAAMYLVGPAIFNG